MIYSKTEAGQQVVKDRSVPLTPRQRSAFILFDGKRSVAQVLAATTGLGASAEDVQYLVDHGLLVAAAGQPAAAAPPSTSAAAATVAAPAVAVEAAPAVSDSGRSAQQRYQDAYPIATQLTAGLGLRGFRLNLAVEAAVNYEKLQELAPKIREAVGADKFASLDQALNG